MGKYEKLKWHIEQRKVSVLTLWENNPRFMSDKDREDLHNSFNKFNYVEVVIINTDNKVIGGHQRLKELLSSGRQDEVIDVRVPNRKLSAKEFSELAIRLNKNRGDWDHDKLASFFDAGELRDWGFDDQDLNSFFDQAAEIFEDEFNVEREYKKIKKPITRPGDVYILGGHKLFCGDSTVPENCTSLMGNERASVIYCDPPYNIGYNYQKGLDKRSMNNYTDTAVVDNKSGEDYFRFIQATLCIAIAHSEKNLHIFYWCDQNYIGTMQAVFKDSAVIPKRVCFWIKNTFNPVPQIAFNKLIEPCVYGTMGSPKLNRNIKNLTELLNKQSPEEAMNEAMSFLDAWLVHRVSTNDYEHPTQKPLSLHEKPLKRCSAPGDIIIDLFGGGGSTLISCEQLKRKARLMEQDPVFCDVIVKRWERFTGKKAILINGNT